MKKKSKWNFLIFCFSVVGILLYSVPVTAGGGFICGPSSICTSDADCFGAPDVSCPVCFGCNQTTGFCEPVDAKCDDGNECTEDACIFDEQNFMVGCINTSIALGGDPNLDIACYVCEPTANNVTVNNGICDLGAGENCSNSPEDCLVPGETCGPPPPLGPGGCDAQVPAVLCTDGDRCTIDFCDSSVNPNVCVNLEIPSCIPIFSDGCCPLNQNTGLPCEGPGAGSQCDPNDPDCDPDCWPPQSCGDGFVQPDETCDASADAGNAGVQPNGQPVLDSQCRQPGTEFECTYCGDGIVQSPLEQCELNELGACGGAGCGINCLCQADICLEGSGDLVGGEGNAAAPLPAFCDTCSLNINAPHGGILGWALGIGFMLLPGGIQWIRRRMS